MPKYAYIYADLDVLDHFGFIFFIMSAFLHVWFPCLLISTPTKSVIGSACGMT